MTRIIGGTAGGRRLKTPTGDATRPTSDRVREALFSALESQLGSLTGLRFLDLYAGSGAIGLEAMSRGAGVVTSVESDRRTARMVQDNASTLGFRKVEVVALPVARVLGQHARAPYDVVFADPPYPLDNAELEQVLALLVAHGWVAPGSRARAWSARRVAWNPPGPRVWCASGARSTARRCSGTFAPIRRPTTHDPGGPPDDEQRHVRRAVCPGSFDPVTNGHIDIISRASLLFDEVVVAVGINKSKSRARLFTAEERIAMLEKVCADFPNVTVAGFEGLLTTFCQERDIRAIVKGLRAVSDFDYELQMAQMNSSLVDVETVFIPTSPEWSFLASSLVKEVAMFGGDVSGLLPPDVLIQLTERLAERARSDQDD